MLKKVSKIGALVLLLIAPIVFWVLNSNAGWHEGPELWPAWRYLLNDLFLAWLALECVVGAFLLVRASSSNGRKAMAGLALTFATVLGCWILNDLYVVLVCNDSTGPGGRLCLTHRNWYERVVNSNSDGFWEDDLEPYKQAGRERPVVVAIGDSFTFGQGVASRSERYTDILAQGLRPELDFLNISRGGLNTREQQTHLLPTVAKVHPSAVVYFYLTNDIHDSIGRPAPTPKPRSKWDRRFLVGSPTWNYWYWKVFAALSFEKAAGSAHTNLIECYQHERNFNEHRQDLKQLLDEIRALGAQPLVVVLPYPHLWSGADEAVRSEVLGKIEKTFVGLNTPVLRLDELEKRFPVGSFEVNSMDAHPSAEVHKAIAAEALPWLQEHLVTTKQ